MINPLRWLIPRRLRSRRVALALLALIVVVQVWNFITSRITISPETTVIVEPIADDGLPDFEAHVLARQSDGVTPENNAVVLLAQALWPMDISDADQPAIQRVLSMDAAPDPEGLLIPIGSESTLSDIEAWLVETHRVAVASNSELRDAAYAIEGQAYNRPWRETALPPLARWLQDNERAIDLIASATKRRRFFAPSPEFLDENRDLLMDQSLSITHTCRRAMRALAARAMARVGAGRLDDAWEDVRAEFRLAALLGQGWSVVEQLVGHAVYGVAASNTIAILQHPDLTAAQARRILIDLQELPALPPLADVFDDAERLVMIDYVLNTATGRVAVESLDDGPLSGTANWDFVLKEINGGFDQLVAAMSIADRAGRTNALAAWQQALDERSNRVSRPLNLALAIVSQDKRSEVLADIFISLMMPAQPAAMAAHDRVAETRELTETAAALAVYRCEHGEYPATLHELAPAILPATPLDSYSGSPPVYRPIDDGYVLYSVFNNGIDDGGTNYDGEIVDGEWQGPDDEPVAVDYYDNSDLVVRVPVPSLRVPTMRPVAD